MSKYDTLAQAQLAMSGRYGQPTAGYFCRALDAPADPNQYGVTCGLYGLRNVMRYHYHRAGLTTATERLRRHPQLGRPRRSSTSSATLRCR